MYIFKAMVHGDINMDDKLVNEYKREEGLEALKSYEF